MSSSPRQAAIPRQNRQAGSADIEILPFRYSEARLPTAKQDFVRTEPSPSDETHHVSNSTIDPQRELQLRELGRQQGIAETRAKFDEQLHAARAAVAQAVADFSRERIAYYRRIEEETVQLALAIARKVIHREAQVDPMLLMGIVRVALEKIEGVTRVALHVPNANAQEWRRHLASHLDPAQMPEITEDASLSPGRCALKSAMGTIDLGFEVQLKEVEQGLMDLLAARPETKA
jgi:flagellar biosynthesis/type III secretory pathway protein FliH